MFTAPHWFESTARKNFEHYLLPLAGKSLRFLEIGCFDGMATCWMLENVLTNEESEIYAIDTFKGAPEWANRPELDAKWSLSRFKENTSKYDFQIEIWQGESWDALRLLAGYNRYDFIYIDGSHHAADVLEDGVLSFRLLKKGGLMIFDDPQWQGNPGQPLLNPGPGINALLTVYADQIEVLPSFPRNVQTVIRKK